MHRRSDARSCPVLLWCLSIPLRDDVIRQTAREGGMIKGKRRDEDAGENIQDNNGTKMATASAMGRPPASKPPRRPEEPWMTSRCIHSPYSKRMTTSMTYWNYQANLSHHYRWASTVSSSSTLALPPLPSNHQTLKHSDVWLPCSIPSIHHDLPF